MNADITENSILFKKTFDERSGSERRSTTRGVNTADLLIIKHQDANDNQYKVKTKRHLLRIDREDIDEATGQKYVTSAYITIVVPELATSAQVDDVVATLRAVVANVTSGTEYLEQLLNDER
jgi:hypothetical protein